MTGAPERVDAEAHGGTAAATAPVRTEAAPVPTLRAPPEMARRLSAAGLAPLRLAGREVLPIVQGGMGVGVSAHRLAGAVAAHAAVGTIASVDLRRHPPT